MHLLRLHIYLVLSFALALSSCKSDRKIYESTNTKSKDKKNRKSKFALTKYNKLLKNGDSEAKYSEAIKYFNKKNYSKALPLFEDVLSAFKGTEKGPEVQYYYSFCNYYVKDYIVAGYQFRTFVKNYPNNEHTEICAYMNADCYYQSSPEYSLDQSDTEVAVREFQKFANTYPKSQYVADCNQKLDILREKLDRKSFENALLYFNTENYKSSIVAFNNHIKDFPDTKRIEYASFLIVKSHYLLAKNSIDSKKMERYKATIESYIKFAEKYPESSFLKEARKINSDAIEEIEKSNKL